MAQDDGSAKWIEAGLDELAEGGVDRVRVEVVAERLGVTKGGFYRRFRDRRALLDAILETWSKGRVAALDQQVGRGGASPGERLMSLVKLYSERVNPQGMAIELAIRQWARSDAAAAAAVALVDADRLAKVGALYTAMGLTKPEAEVRAVLFYAFLFGQSLLFLDHAPRKRASLVESCARHLIGPETAA